MPELSTVPPSTEPTSTPTPGILYVTSRLLAPAPLPRPAFESWYETTHAPAVLALPGVESAVFYDARPVPRSTSTTDTDTALALAGPAEYLILYFLPDLAYLSSPAFQHLASHPAPGEDEIYKSVAFDIRTLALTPSTSTSTASSTSISSLVPTAQHGLFTLSFPAGLTEEEREEKLARLSGVEGVAGVGVFEARTRVLRVGGVVDVKEVNEGEGVVVVWLRGRAVEDVAKELGGEGWGSRRVWAP